MGEYRLDRLLAECGIASRSQSRELIRNGRVRINGKAAARPETKADPERDAIEVDGQPLLWSRSVCYMLNKPSGVVTAVSDRDHPTVMSLIADRRKGLAPVGRLDLDTEGLLLITDDGGLAHRLLSPRYHVPKTYYLETDVPVPGDAAEVFASGVDLGDFVTRPAVYVPVGEQSGRLTIVEGKFHQVKRMLEAVGCRVTYLKRESFGGLELDPALAPGGYRRLSGEELEKLDRASSRDRESQGKAE